MVTDAEGYFLLTAMQLLADQSTDTTKVFFFFAVPSEVEITLKIKLKRF